MSGTSLDGLDIAYCHFRIVDNQWQFDIPCATTVPYSEEWKTNLSTLSQASAEQYAKIDTLLGHYIGQEVAKFVASNHLQVDFVASHGHTIFHQPQCQFTAQIGHGAAIAAECACPVVCDFRTLDVALGGQGAPLVPIGDAILFADYTYCLNIGGIANVSYKYGEKRIAFDISPANMAFNFFANQLGKEYDKDGLSAKAGQFNQNLFDSLNRLDYYHQAYPKSLGREWFEQVFLPAVYNEKIVKPEDILSTLCHHAAFQLSQVIENKSGNSVLLTGGGAKNSFLVDLFQQYAPKVKFVVPEKSIIDYKEALIFALLGVLRWNGQYNCLSSVTGAVKNAVGGAIYYNVN